MIMSKPRAGSLRRLLGAVSDAASRPLDFATLWPEGLDRPSARIVGMGAAGGTVPEMWQAYCVATITRDHPVADGFGDTLFTLHAGEEYLLTEYGMRLANRVPSWP